MQLIVNHDPEKNFESLWRTFNRRYPFFELRGVDWKRQYEIYKPRITNQTTDIELFDILCEMLSPLNDGHVELRAKFSGESKRRLFCPEIKPRFWQEFTNRQINQLFKITKKTLAANGFQEPRESEAWILQYCRSQAYGYIRILELEGVKTRCLTAALDTIAQDFHNLNGMIIDVRDNPGGDDSTAITIANRFCDRKRVAFHRKSKIGPGDSDFTKLKTSHIEPQGNFQFAGPIMLLTCDSVFSGGEIFALAINELPYTTIIGEHTNGIFSYQLERILPNGWNYLLSYQMYFSADMTCYEGSGVPADVELVNKKSDIENGVDPLIVCALELLGSVSVTSVIVDKN